MPERGITPEAIFIKFGLGGTPRPAPRAKFNHCHFKMWAYSPKIVEIGNFWYKFAQKRVYPLKRFLQYLAWGGSPRSAPSYQISLLWL